MLRHGQIVDNKDSELESLRSKLTALTKMLSDKALNSTEALATPTQSSLTASLTQHGVQVGVTTHIYLLQALYMYMCIHIFMIRWSVYIDLVIYVYYLFFLHG
jgi:hypothetical protein